MLCFHSSIPETVKTILGEITFAFVQLREGGFSPSALENDMRSKRALAIALAKMYVQDDSTSKGKATSEDLCGLEISAMVVSLASAQLESALQECRERPLGEIGYLFVDAFFEWVRNTDQVRNLAVLVASGITPEDERQVLGVFVSHSEHVELLFKVLKVQGIHCMKSFHRQRL